MEIKYDAILIGGKISKLRQSKGLSIRKLSKAVGITDTALAKIESGSTKSITIGLGKEIAKALEVSFNQLFDIEVQKDDSLLEELKAENEILKEQIGIKNKESLLYVKIIDGLENEIKSLKDKIEAINEHLITWPEYFIMGSLSSLRKDFNDHSISEDDAVRMATQVLNIASMAFLFSTKFQSGFIDILEKRLKKKYESIYDEDFKLFISTLREIQADHIDFEKEIE